MNRYETNLKNTSPVIENLRNEFAKMPRGVHDLTYRADFDASDGYIIPIDYHELVPNSDLYLKYDVSLLSHNPTFRRLLSGASIELRTYKRLKSDSFKGWNNFITKGRTGKVVKSLPYVDFLLGTELDSSNHSSYFCTLTPHSPACYLGFVPSVFLGVNNSNYSNFVKSSYPQKTLTISKNNPPYNISDFLTGLSGIDSIAKVASSTALRINALPLVMYNSIVKQFSDLNLLINEQSGTFSKWVPENEDNDMILPYEATGAAISSEFDNWDKPLNSGEATFDVTMHSRPFLNILHRANKLGDYFDTGSPFPDLLRGDIPTVDIVGGAITGGVVSGDVTTTTTVNTLLNWLDSIGTYNENHNEPILLDNQNNKLTGSTSASSSYNSLRSALEKVLASSSASSESVFSNGKITGASLSSIQFSMNQWRNLATLTVFAERMARTDGSYNELIKAQFGHNPNWHGHEPVFCGGSRQPLVFSEVVQQSASSESGTPLGTTAGRSVSSQENGTISIHTDDYCDVMTVMVIRSDEYYCQGVDKRVSRLENIEQYFPIMNNLAPDATLNKELFVSGNNDSDNNVFNYQERFAYFKSLRNRVSGLLALPFSVVGSIGQYVKHRIFQATPNFNIAFSQDSEDANMKSIYTSNTESEYVINVGVSAKLVAPIPEVTVPSDMGISY